MEKITPSYYYKYQFTSPEPIFALVKEELKSYFDTGAVDDLLFPKWTDKCLKLLGKSSLSINETFLDINDFVSTLPDNFDTVREAWMITDLPTGFPFRSATSVYTQTTFQVQGAVDPSNPCNTPDCSDCPEIIQAVYKTNHSISFSFKKKYLLKPGNISVRDNCSLDCANIGSNELDTFDIRDNKFVTNFRKGTVYLIFYAIDRDELGNQLIPDDYYIMEYIEAFLKYKCFETLSNNVIDETAKQIEQKVQYYKSLSDEAYILASSSIKKQDVHHKIMAIKRIKNKFRKYEIDRPSYGWRR